MARLSPENHLKRIQKYFSILGSINGPIIQEQNMQITKFKIAANQMRVFLLKFKEQLDVCDEDF